jgi:hypothetical protein
MILTHSITTAEIRNPAKSFNGVFATLVDGGIWRTRRDRCKAIRRVRASSILRRRGGEFFLQCKKRFTPLENALPNPNFFGGKERRRQRETTS